MEYLLFIFSSIVSLLVSHWKPRKVIHFNNILVIRLDHIGDLVWSLEAVHRLRMQFNHAKITILVGEWNVDILKNSTDIDEVVIYNSPMFTRNKIRILSNNNRKKLQKDLRLRGFDLIVGLRDDMFTIKASLLIWPQMRVDRGTVRIWMKLKGLLKNQLSHEYHTNMAIIDPICPRIQTNDSLIVFSDDENQWLDEYLAIENIKRGSYAVFHPGASWEFRRWSAKNYEAIAIFLFEKYKLKTYIIGSPDEVNIGRQLVQNRPDIIINVIGQSTLRETMRLLSGAKIAVCNDSGPMHLASAMKIPLISLLGPQDAARFGPRGENVICFQKEIECRPCDQVVCKYPKRPCVELNTVKEVIEEIPKVIGR
jgi:ADP-heptose:LPS heptosyltransferase